MAARQPGLAVPAAWEVLAEDAAAHCPGLPWSVLSAVGRVESDSGRSSAPGVASGANLAGAEGPMQFEPATFARYGVVGPGGVSPPSPYDPVDAIYSAAHLLCSDGAARPSTLARAIDAYNHSSVYVATVLVLAEALDADPTLPADAAAAIQFRGRPTRHTVPMGRVRAGRVRLLRPHPGRLPLSWCFVAAGGQAQFDAGPAVASGNVRPGDLLFYGTSTRAVDHVGIYVGAGEMIDAPHTGAVVREEPADWDDFVGATRPG